MKKIVIILFILFVLIADQAFAQLKGFFSGNLPVPPRTQEIKKTKRKIADMDFDFIAYQSSSSLESIRSFYRKRFKREGWEELDFSKHMPKLKVPVESVPLFLERNLAFQKGDILVTLTFMPDGLLAEGKTGFTLTRGNTAFKEYTPEIKKQELKEDKDKRGL